MSNLKDKSQTFLIGLMAGLLIAGGFFILKLDDYFKELNFYKNIAKTFISSSKTEEAALKTDDKVAVIAVKPKSNTFKNRNVSNNVDSNKVSNSNSGFLLDADTVKKFSANDTSGLNVFSSSENIVVKKDEIISTKTMEVINLGNVTNKLNLKDSLLNKISGMKDNKSVTKQFINIELWQSPLNYKGYKMSKYKIALYGIVNIEGLKIYSLDDVIYLRNGSMVYKLEVSSEYKSYENIVEESLLSKLK